MLIKCHYFRWTSRPLFLSGRCCSRQGLCASSPNRVGVGWDQHDTRWLTWKEFTHTSAAEWWGGGLFHFFTQTKSVEYLEFGFKLPYNVLFMKWLMALFGCCQKRRPFHWAHWLFFAPRREGTLVPLGFAVTEFSGRRKIEKKHSIKYYHVFN